MIRIGLVAPKAVLRSGLRSLLEEFFSSQPNDYDVICVVKEAKDFNGLELLSEALDVILVTDDVIDGLGLEKLKLTFTDISPVLMLIETISTFQNFSNLPKNIWGVLPLDSTPGELAAAIKAIAMGLVVLSPAIMQASGITDLIYLSMGNGTIFAERNSADDNFPAEALTSREKEVLQFLAQGLANKQIALALKISEHTVKFHVSSIYAKLGVTNRTEATRRGIQQGLILI